MAIESAEKAYGERRAGTPTGFRRLTPGLLHSDRMAEAFAGLPDGVTVPGKLLAAFKAAAPRLGIQPRLTHAVDWLFRFTMPQDWEAGSRPIVWPSASFQASEFGLSPTQVKAINRALIEAGLVTMKDSPNGKRYGKRDRKDCIVEAYGFDLSPFAARYAEFVRVAEEAKAERIAMGRLRRRATIARKGVIQILETAAEYGFDGDEWMRLRRDSMDLAKALKTVERPEEMALGVESLERRHRTARERLEQRLAKLAPASSEAVDSDPKGTENRPHYYTYKTNFHLSEDTVAAFEGSKAEAEPAPAISNDQPADQLREITATYTGRTDRGTIMKLSTDELVQLAPRLRPYLRHSTPNWRDVVEAADWLRHDLDISKSLWGEACISMGREQAAIALAIVSAKPTDYFRTTAGGYFHGMVAKAKAGELNLGRTIWGLRAVGNAGSNRSKVQPHQ
jgi:replication initiation protein RepC